MSDREEEKRPKERGSVCVTERERETDRQIDRERERGVGKRG